MDSTGARTYRIGSEPLQNVRGLLAEAFWRADSILGLSFRSFSEERLPRGVIHG
jgi:hypothetical protein